MCKIVVFAAHSVSFYRSYRCRVESGANLARKTDGKIHFMRQPLCARKTNWEGLGTRQAVHFLGWFFIHFYFLFLSKRLISPHWILRVVQEGSQNTWHKLVLLTFCKCTKLPFEVSGSFLLTVLYHVACWKLSYRNHRRLDHNTTSRLLWKLDKQIPFSSRTFWKLIS